MKYERASLRETFLIVRDAIKFRVNRQNEYLQYVDNKPLCGIQKIIVIADLLKPSEIKKSIHILSSFNWGRHILNEVFPKFNNPNEYHSRDGG